MIDRILGESTPINLQLTVDEAEAVFNVLNAAYSVQLVPDGGNEEQTLAHVSTVLDRLNRMLP